MIDKMTKSGRKKLVIELQYLGTAYNGWQPQPNQSSVYDVVAAGETWLREGRIKAYTQNISSSRSARGGLTTTRRSSPL